MTPEERKFYDAYLETFLSKGWTQFMEQVEKLKEGLIQGAWTCENERTLYRVKGQIEVYDALQGFEEAIRNEYDQVEKVEQEPEDDTLAVT